MRIVTYVILAILVLVYFSPLNFYNTGVELLDYQLRAFYHANLTHLLANSISLLALSSMENVMGSPQYLFMIVFIWLLSSTILYLIHKFFPSRKVYTVGFSGVIFGMMVVYFTMLSSNAMIAIGGLVVSILPQIFIPGISWEGHLAGIIAGLIFIVFFPSKGKFTGNSKSLLGFDMGKLVPQA